MSRHVDIKWWHAGGLHIHITRPDGSWERRTYPKHEYWRVDQAEADMRQLFPDAIVLVTP